jgi:prostaglandin reductase 2
MAFFFSKLVTRRFTNALNYKKEGFAEKLAEACKDGVDVYFDNVGGEISRKVVVEFMKPGGRVVLCGQIADYNKDMPYPPPIPDDMQVCYWP